MNILNSFRHYAESRQRQQEAVGEEVAPSDAFLWDKNLEHHLLSYRNASKKVLAVDLANEVVSELHGILSVQ